MISVINELKHYYQEIQRPKQFWVWGLMLLLTGFMWYAFLMQIIFDQPFGSNPAPDAVVVILWILLGIVFPIVMLLAMKLIVEVRDDGLYVRYVPFHRRYKVFLYEDIQQYKAITYNPHNRFGGWGIRTNLKGEIAYNSGFYRSNFSSKKIGR